MKKLQVFSVLVMILAMVVIGCQNGTQEVEGDVGINMVAVGLKVAAGFDVTTPSTKDGTFIVNFTPANKAVGYTYYLSTNKDIIAASNDANTKVGYSYSAAGVKSPTGTNAIDPTKAYFITDTVGDKASYYVGIQAYDALNNRGNIVWSGTATVAVDW